jgi:hypothetical protein
MRVVVADVMALQYLILVDAVEVFPCLFGHLYIPAEAQDDGRKVKTRTL